MSPDARRSYALGAITVLFWSTVATAFKLTLRSVDVFQLLLYATLTSVLVLGCLLMLQGKGKLLRSSLTPRKLRYSLLAGLMTPFAYYLVLFSAYDRLPAQVAQPINFTWAIMLTLMSIVILKQRIGVRDMIASVVCYGGVVVIASQGNTSDVKIVEPIGIMLALASTVIWASYWIYNIKDSRDPVVALFVNFSVALPFCALACVVFSDLSVPDLTGMIGVVYIGIFEMGLAFVTWSLALKLAENTSRVSNLIFVSPFLSLVFIANYLGEPIFDSTYIGLVLILVGLIIQRTGERAADR